MFNKCLAFVMQFLLVATVFNIPVQVTAQAIVDENDPAEGLSNSSANPETLPISIEEREATLAQIQSQLEYLESSRDAYDIGISELSLELGAHYAELGYYDQSLEAYRRALHIARINYGLTSEQQLPILEQFLELYEEAGHMDEADFIFQKMLLIYQENYDPWSPAVASLYERIGSWHLAAYYFEIDEEPVSHLVAANRALSNAHYIGRAQRDYSYNFDMYNLLTLTNWGLSTFYTGPGTNNDFSNDRRDFSRDENMQISGAFRSGRLLLEEGIEAAAKTDDPENIARATLMYADWNQMFNRPRTARTHYLQAYEYIQQLAPDNPLRQSFGMPHALPNFDESEFSFRPQNNEHHEIPLAFDVSEWGMPQSISVDDEAVESLELPAVVATEKSITQEEESLSEEEMERQWEDATRKAMSAIRSTKFRPAIIDGQPSDYQNVKQVILVAKES
ncbi:MAG: tetratricopeptide repeat protein [Pseudomonadales bacterium]